jgi:cytochrome b561
MTSERKQFSGSVRFFHWLVAAMVLTMLGIGVAMIASLADYHWLISIHRPLGILLLIIVSIRLVNWLLHGSLELPISDSHRSTSVPISKKCAHWGQFWHSKADHRRRNVLQIAVE